MAHDMDTVFKPSALPLEVGLNGEVVAVGAYKLNNPVFADDKAAFDYMLRIAKRDLQLRGFRDDRITSFEFILF